LFDHEIKREKHMHELNQLPFPLAKLIEPGLGFRIGGEAYDFVPVASHGKMRTFEDNNSKLQMHVRVDVHDHAVVVSGSLENNGSAPVSGIDIINPLHLVFRNPSSEWRHIHAHGGTSEAFYPPLAYRTYDRTYAGQGLRIESHPAGRSSNLHLPFLISLASRSEDSDGFFCGMEWSGAWHMTFDKVDEIRSSLSVGVKVSSLEIGAGEVLDLPNIHLGFFKGGPEAGTNALRRYLYEHVCPPYQGKPLLPRVSYDHWFGIGNNLNFDEMKRQAVRAAELGIEVFVVDAAWFSGDFPDGVGNWNEVDRAKFPDGLEPLAEYIRSLDMDFGLWFEIERAHDGTQALREHPEFFIPHPATYPARNNAHLNLARRDAQDWTIETVGHWIKRLDLRWSRWDYNIEPQPFWDAVDTSGKIQFEYFKGLYRVLDTLMSEHPNWMVEGCASGGRRIDIGTMKRAHTYWFSDQTDIAPVCRYMQARANRFLPGQLLNSSVAVGWENGDKGFDDASVLSRMIGKLAFDGDIGSWSPALSVRMAAWVREFKKMRHLLVKDFYQLLPIPTTAEDWDAVQFVSYPGDEAVVFVFSGCDGGTCRLRLRALDTDLTYSMSRTPGGSVTTHTGADLMRNGFTIEMEGDDAGLWKIIGSNKPDAGDDK
jgi:alpha-galactosidase